MNKLLKLEVRKRNEAGHLKQETIDITPLDGILSPEEIFMMEFVLNIKVPTARFHISMEEVNS